MDQIHGIVQWWRDRLEEGRVFAIPRGCSEGLEYRQGDAPDPAWPEYVAKGALYADYAVQAATWKHEAANPQWFFRTLAPFIYPAGAEIGTIRMRVKDGTHTSQRYFLRLPPIAVAAATFRYRNRLPSPEGALRSDHEMLAAWVQGCDRKPHGRQQVRDVT